MIGTITSRPFELIRDQIIQILNLELPNQNTLQPNLGLNASIFKERFVNIQSSELPAVNVGLANGDGTHGQFLLHILVAKHFIPNPYNYPQVNHMDGNKEWCDKDNLEWMTSQQNNEHALQIGLRPGYMSADHKETYLFRILDGVQVGDLAREIGRRPETLHKMLRETAKRLGIHDQWEAQMQENRRVAAIRNLKKINA